MWLELNLLSRGTVEERKQLYALPSCLCLQYWPCYVYYFIHVEDGTKISPNCFTLSVHEWRHTSNIWSIEYLIMVNIFLIHCTCSQNWRHLWFSCNECLALLQHVCWYIKKAHRCIWCEIVYIVDDCCLWVLTVLVHGQVTIIFVVSVCLFVCAEFFSAVFDPISIKLGHMLYVWV